MKKTLSVLLAVLLVALTVVPAFAAGGEYTVEFVQPSATLETVDGFAAYSFVMTENGTAAYGPVENGSYVFFNHRYMPISNVIEPEQYNFTEFFGPVVFRGDYNDSLKNRETVQAGPDYPIGAFVPCEEGEIISFVVLTNAVYNAATASVYVNGEPIVPETNGEYRIYVDRDLQISVREDDGAGNMLLQRNMFAVTLPSGDGYSVRPLEGTNYALVPYGGDFSFRVKISKGFTDAGMTVKAMRGSSGLEELLGEDIGEMIGMLPVMEGTEAIGIRVEALQSNGIDANGYRTYTLKNITDNSQISVSGVREESSSNLLAVLKRILRLILDFFGIKLDILDSITNIYEVNVNTDDSDRISYAIKSGSSADAIAPSSFEVSSGDSVTIEVATTWADCDNHVNVAWKYVDSDGNTIASVNGRDYNSPWMIKRNPDTGAIYYTRLFVVDNITSNVVITITES